MVPHLWVSSPNAALGVHAHTFTKQRSPISGKIIKEEGRNDKINIPHQLYCPNDRIVEFREVIDQAIAIEHVDNVVLEIKEGLYS